MKKQYRAYLYVRSSKKSDRNRTKLRVRVIAKGRELTATFPLLVIATFSDYFNSNGTFRSGYHAVSFREQYDYKCIKAAYKSACKVAEFMLSQDPDFWTYAPNSFFSYWVVSVFEDVCDGCSINQTNLDNHIEAQSKKKADGYKTDEERDLADWKYKAGVGPKPPMSAWAMHIEKLANEEGESKA